MPSDSVLSFLELARECRMIELGLLAEIAQSDSNLSSLCRNLVGRGALTEYQSEHIRTGRGYGLQFAGYFLRDVIGPVAFGTAFHALHPILRTPVILRRLIPDSPALFLERAGAAAGVSHPNLAAILEVGSVGSETYIALEPFEGATLKSLIDDMGAMPGALAAEYIRRAATGVSAAHARGVFHGGLRPENLVVGPLVQSSKPKADGSPRFRPASTATVKVFELGMIPPPATAAGDVRDLGATLYFLLTKVMPGGGPLSELRPDLPVPLVELTNAMMAAYSGDRPTMASVAAQLAAHGHTKSDDSSMVALGESGEVGLAETEQIELMNEAPQLKLAHGWAGHPAVVPIPAAPIAWIPQPHEPIPQADFTAEVTSPRSPRSKPAAGNRTLIWIWLGAFLALTVLSLGVWFLTLSDPFGFRKKADTKQK